jgi:hypothetical protein
MFNFLYKELQENFSAKLQEILHFVTWILEFDDI